MGRIRSRKWLSIAGTVYYYFYYDFYCDDVTVVAVTTTSPTSTTTTKMTTTTTTTASATATGAIPEFLLLLPLKLLLLLLLLLTTLSALLTVLLPLNPQHLQSYANCPYCCQKFCLFLSSKMIMRTANLASALGKSGLTIARQKCRGCPEILHWPFPTTLKHVSSSIPSWWHRPAISPQIEA